MTKNCTKALETALESAAMALQHRSDAASTE